MELAVTALLCLAAPALAQTQPRLDLSAAYPQLVGEVDMGLYGIGTTRTPERRQGGTQGFLFGEIAAGLHLTPNFSIQSVIHVEPVGEGEPDGGTIGFRRQGASLEALTADWRPTDTLSLYAGKFTAPFGRGHHDFPGILPMIRAHETYMIRESLGVGATWTFLTDTLFGEHDLSAAAFTLDTSFLSNTLITRRRCCAEGVERYDRNTRAQGGPGNTGRLDNFAVALDGDRFGFLPDFSYHLAIVSRGAGRDGTAREWGYAAGLRTEVRWTPELRTLVFAEHVVFRPAGGRPRVEVESVVGTSEEGEALLGTEGTVATGARSFSTLGAHRLGAVARDARLAARPAEELRGAGAARGLCRALGRPRHRLRLRRGCRLAARPHRAGGGRPRGCRRAARRAALPAGVLTPPVGRLSSPARRPSRGSRASSRAGSSAGRSARSPAAPSWSAGAAPCGDACGTRAAGGCPCAGCTGRRR